MEFEGHEQSDIPRIDEIVGVSPAIEEVRTLIRKVAPTQSTVLIQGESGTGKELVAKAIHRLSTRGNGPLISLNCAAVPAELVESELFGHKKGAFTGAINDSKGVFRAAEGGTLFLDEIEATSPAMQIKLLRALQQGEVKPVGDITTYYVNTRVIVATNQNLWEFVKQGKFREDLFYRINVFPIVVPPLRDRPEDIPILIEHFLGRFAQITGKVLSGVDSAALELLTRYAWPGNVRELINELEHAHVLATPGTSLSVRCLSERLTEATSRERGAEAFPKSVTLKEAVELLEKKMVAEALSLSGGNRTVAARRLGLSRQGLLNKIARYGLEDGRYAPHSVVEDEELKVSNSSVRKKLFGSKKNGFHHS